MKQSKAQKIGSEGESIIELQVKQSQIWIARNLNEDYGIDLELEYAPDDVTGKIIKAQIKAHEHIKLVDGFLSQQLSKSFLRYCFECRIPIILIVVDTTNLQSWNVWLQKYIIENSLEKEIYDEEITKSISVKISQNNIFLNALKDSLITIAIWENKTQLYISLNDLAHLAYSQYDNKLSQILFGYIDELEPKYNLRYFDKLINHMFELGSSIWGTNNGNKVSSLIYDFIRNYGYKLNLKHIEKLVLRDENYSRTGINGLSILYDEFPDHTKSLKLPLFFASKGVDLIAFYCEKREQHIRRKSPLWIKEIEIKAEDKYIISDDFDLDKWANRGESAILDYTYVR